LLPPPVVDKRSHKLVDGAHTWTAHRSLNPDNDIAIEVEGIVYLTEHDLFMDAVRRNATHGKALSNVDISHCVIVAEELHIDMAELSKITYRAIAKLSDVRVKSCAFDTGGNPVVLPNSARGAVGRILSDDQIQVMRSTSNAFPPTRMGNALAGILESGLYDPNSDAFVQMLERLQQAISNALAMLKMPA
jgi:hypothetical protein